MANGNIDYSRLSHDAGVVNDGNSYIIAVSPEMPVSVMAKTTGQVVVYGSNKADEPINFANEMVELTSENGDFLYKAESGLTFISVVVSGANANISFSRA